MSDSHKRCAGGCGARLGGKKSLYLGDDGDLQAGVEKSGDLYCRDDYVTRFGVDPVVEAAVLKAGADG
jgi:hypothetical protein